MKKNNLKFLQNYSRGELDVALSTLVEEGKIRRVLRGIYDYPIFSSTLNRNVAPDIDQVARALARKFNWIICPLGDVALNYLGLSNQMVAKPIYLSDGPSKTYHIDEITIEFKHIAKKEVISNDETTALVIQAIKAIGEKQVNDDFIKRLSQKFTKAEWNVILTNATRSASWIYDIIKKAANFEQGE